MQRSRQIFPSAARPSPRGRHWPTLALLVAACTWLHASAFSAGLDWAPLLTHLPSPVVSLPATSVNGTLLVDAMINGSGPFHLLVDTGCSCSIISPDVALVVDARSAEDSGYIATVNAFGDSAAVPHVLLDSIELGGVRFEGINAGITSLDLQSQVAGERIDGILGYTLFSELFLTLDFPHQRVQLSRDWPRDLPPVRAQLDLTEESAVPYVVLAIQDRHVPMMIDSGANGGLLFDATTAAALTWKVEPRVAGLVAAMGGTGRDWVGRLAGSAGLGGVRQIEPVATVTSGISRIGTAFLRTHCAVFSRALNKLWLCSASDAPLASPPARTVGLSLLADATDWRIAGIIPGSPAEKARLGPGDTITGIEHSPARSWSREDLQRWMDNHPTLALTVARSVGPTEITLPVWVMVP